MGHDASLFLSLIDLHCLVHMFTNLQSLLVLNTSMHHAPSNIESNDNFPSLQLNMWSLPQPYTKAGWDSIANNEKPRVTFVSLFVIFTARLKGTGTESFEALQSASSCSFVQSLVPFSDSTKEKLKKAKNNRTAIFSPKLCVNNWRCRGRSFKTNRAVLGEF